MNSVNISGRLTKDPDLRKTLNGTSVLNLTLACDRRIKNEDQPSSDFIPVVLWSKPAEFISSYARKGTFIEVSGSIETGSYEKNGKTEYSWHIKGDQVKIIAQPKSKTQEVPASKPAPEYHQTTLGGPSFHDEYESRIDDVDSDSLPFY